MSTQNIMPYESYMIWLWYGMIWCDMQCYANAMLCYATRCDAMWCDVMRCDVTWCTLVCIGSMHLYASPHYRKSSKSDTVKMSGASIRRLRRTGMSAQLKKSLKLETPLRGRTRFESPRPTAIRTLPPEIPRKGQQNPQKLCKVSLVGWRCSHWKSQAAVDEAEDQAYIRVLLLSAFRELRLPWYDAV